MTFEDLQNNEQAAKAFGDQLVEVFGMKPIGGATKELYQTAWGRKTRVGLVNTIVNLLEQTPVPPEEEVVPPKPVITISYSSDGPPDVELPEGLDVEIKLIDSDELYLRYMEHQGTVIYQTYWKTDIRSDFWYSFEYQPDEDPVRAFDVRDLPRVPKEQQPKYDALFKEEDQQRIAHAIDAGFLKVPDES